MRFLGIFLLSMKTDLKKKKKKNINHLFQEHRDYSGNFLRASTCPIALTLLLTGADEQMGPQVGEGDGSHSSWLSLSPGQVAFHMPMQPA